MRLGTRSVYARLVPLAGLALILALGLVLYRPSLGFGFFWDDPAWFRRVAGRSVLEALAPRSDFQFWRPATLLVTRLFANAGGTYDPMPLHAAQIAVHLANIILVYALCRQLALARRTALAGAMLFAVLPFAHQVVTWTQAIGPGWVTLCLLAAANAYAAARRARKGGGWLALALILYLLALAFQESAVPYAAVLVLLEWALPPPAGATWIAAPRRRWRVLAPGAFSAVAGVYLVLWVLAPKAPGFLEPRFAPEVAAYLSQGIAFPLLGRPGGWDANTLPGWAVLAAAGGAAIWLAGAQVRAGRWALALLGLGWYAAALLPGWAGLPAVYVLLAPRMFYPAAFGIVLLWAGLVEAGPALGRLRRAWTGLAWILLAVVAVQSIWIVTGFNALYVTGTRHLATLVDWSETTPRASALFVNYPDRYAPVRSQYPIGYWGLTLAPVSEDLGAYPRLENGAILETVSLSAPEMDFDERAASPYVFDLRGVIAGPEELYHAAGEVEHVLVTRFHPDGAMRLLEVGQVVHGAEPAQAPLARFGTALALEAATLERGPDEWRVRLDWRCLEPAQPEDTIFVHLGLAGQPPLAQADGDLLGGLVPLAACRGGDLIVDRRVVPLPAGSLPDGVQMRVGAYNRADGGRLPATDGAGVPLVDGAWVVR